jgi:hypothetical protein
MAVKGNPTALEFIYSEVTQRLITPEWRNIHTSASLFLSKRAAAAFRGFAHAQLRRLQGDGTGKHGQRPEMAEQFGFDTKAAMHTVRLLGEGIELMETGNITMPRPDKNSLIKIRNGEFGTIERLLDYTNYQFDRLDEAEKKSMLPEHVNRDAINKLLSQIYMEFWNRKNE